MQHGAEPLAAYNARRDFGKTAEPQGRAGRASGNGFIVQKHAATRLHWDFRIEVDGVLKSWAVTRGPSLDPSEKRLAVRTEDHPLAYASFEGAIPAREYGGGTVMLWDRGSWQPVAGKSAADLDKGHLHFRLDGERMKGEWLLVRMKPRPGEKRENWLLRKIDDAFAVADDDLVGRALTSIDSGRTMNEIAAGAMPRGAARKGRKQTAAKLPGFAKPQLATLVDHVPAGRQWLHEVKYDGYRCLLAAAGDRAAIYTRTGLDWSDRFPGIIEAARALGLPPALIDGEIVALGDDGKPSFSALQAAIKAGGRGLSLFAFDLLSLDGADLRGLGNIERKDRLRPLIPGGSETLYFAEHIVGAGEALFERMCREGYEGIVSKKADAPYAGRRSLTWLKVKCSRRQEFVVVGWTASDSRSRPFKSLLLAVAENGGLRYAGKVGTGFDAKRLDEIAGKLSARRAAQPALAVPREAARGAKWVAPELVAEVAFAEFTHEGVVRHASFVGLREDKPAAEIVPETAAAPPAEPARVRVSNPARVIFPESGLTKGDLAGYYTDIAAIMLPWAAHRPVSLVRCPQGRAKHCFFQKHDAGSFGVDVHHVDIREKDGGSEPYLYVENASGLIACVQMGTIEFHGWGARVEDVEKPDRMVFDLDPDTEVDFAAVKRAAVRLQTELAAVGLVSFPMLSGGKGVHVVVPLLPGAEWPQVKDFADRFSRALAAASPDRFTATMSKARRKGRIFIDWLRNQRGATAVLPYSARARPGAPVAVPVSWAELDDIESPGAYTIRDAGHLLERAGAPNLRGWGVARQELPDV